jgi:hypothetical protein
MIGYIIVGHLLLLLLLLAYRIHVDYLTVRPLPSISFFQFAICFSICLCLLNVTSSLLFPFRVLSHPWNIIWYLRIQTVFEGNYNSSVSYLFLFPYFQFVAPTQATMYHANNHRAGNRPRTSIQNRRLECFTFTPLYTAMTSCIRYMWLCFLQTFILLRLVLQHMSYPFETRSLPK